jgi:osmotically-inducible protein OsmY
MKYAVIVLSALSLAACDGLSVAEKKPEVRNVPAAAQAVQDGKSERIDARLEADKALAAQVKRALEQEEKALAAAVDVTADRGAITLWGTTSSVDERARLGRVAQRVGGVQSLDNRIAVVKGS